MNYWKGARSLGYLPDEARIGGNGTASTLPMTEEEREQVKTKQPLGFAIPPPPKKP